MEQSINLGENLLRAWLELAATLSSRDMVSGMTYNEAVVCNHLSHSMDTEPDRAITATELCEKIKMKKSQMNQVLTSLESRGYLNRTRNKKDRRQIRLSLTPAGREAYRNAHKGASELLSVVVSRLGPDATKDLTSRLNLANSTVQDVLSARQKKGTL